MPHITNITSSSNLNGNDNNNHTTNIYERLVSEEVKELKEYTRLVEHQSRRLVDLDSIHRDLERRLEIEHSKTQRLERALQRNETTWKARCELLGREKAEAEKRVTEEKVKVDKLMEMVNRLQTEIHTLIRNKFSHENVHGGGIGSNIGGVGIGPPGSVSALRPSTSYGGGNIKRVPSGQAALSSANNNNTNWGHKPSGANVHHSPTSDHHHHHHGHNANGGSVNRRDYSNGSHSASGRMMGRHIGPDEMLACVGSAEAVRERNAFGSLLDFFGM